MPVNRKQKSTKRRSSSRSSSKKQRGGSPASDIVMSAAGSSSVNHDYVVTPRIREGPMADYTLGTPDCQRGGSEASDGVNSNLTTQSVTQGFPPPFTVKGDINSLNLYELTGGKGKGKKGKGKRSGKSKDRKSKSKKTSGKRKSKKSMKNSRNSHKRNHHNNHHNNSLRGGYGSDWISSQYSQGPVNNASGAAAAVAPNRDSAGSGFAMTSLEGAKVGKIGAPVSM